MKNRTSPEKKIPPQDLELIKTVEGYLTEDGYRFHSLAEDCIEMYLQGKNLTMRMLIYAHNRHLVVRVPAFIRNVELRGTEFLLELMNLMNEYFDIRFELSADGQSLSGASNHVVEDSKLGKMQFTQVLMVVAYMVDENYPRLLKILYGQAGVPTNVPTDVDVDSSEKERVGNSPDEDSSESDEASEDPTPTADETFKKPKIN
ncbi:hypothetical protein AUK22_08395 [bacterium CG2_30_54_10]|nr:MAG: hypothetical protein AUK22_08395 [bacterium CG2_30_54_10]